MVGNITKIIILDQIFQDMGLLIPCSPEDPAPAKLLSGNIDFFVPFCVEIVNLSHEYRDTDGLKSAVLILLIKKLSSTVDKEDLKDY